MNQNCPALGVLAVIGCLVTPGAIIAAAGAAPICDAHCVLVDVVVAKEGTFAPTVVLTGSIAPKYQTNVAFRTSGQIVQRLIEIGDHVSADQVLAKLDPRDQTATLDTDKAGLASAEALLVQAEVNFTRQQALFRNGYATRPSFDQAQQQLRTQQAAVDSAKAMLGTAQEQLGYTDLKAGAAGIVIGRDAEAGQVVQAGQTVFVLAQDGPRDAVFDVSEVILTEPPASKTVQVALLSDLAIRTTGHVREISPTVDDKTGAVKVKVALDSVPAGMSLGAVVAGAAAFKPQRAITLPRSALFRWDDGPAVWLFDAKTRTVTPRTVTVQRYDGDTLVISGGIQAGDHDRHIGQSVPAPRPDRCGGRARGGTVRTGLIVALASLAVAGCKEEAQLPAPLRPVLAATVEPVSVDVFGPFASTVEARYQTQLGFQIAGRMVARDVFVGDTVHKGQRLAAIDPAVPQFALLRAKADIANAQAQLVYANGIEARQRSLATTGNAAQATLDNAVAGRDTARARLDQSQAALRMAETQIGYTELNANFDAVVTAWTAEVGQYVDTGKAVVTLARPDVREAVVDIPDYLLGRVTAGMAFTARLQAAPDVTAQAIVREIGPACRRQHAIAPRAPDLAGCLAGLSPRHDDHRDARDGDRSVRSGPDGGRAGR